jgi:hypothetical protein
MRLSQARQLFGSTAYWFEHHYIVMMLISPFRRRGRLGPHCKHFLVAGLLEQMGYLPFYASPIE